MQTESIQIGFEDLKVHTIVGLLPFERSAIQAILVSLNCQILVEPHLANIQKDQLGDIPSYFDLATWIEAHIQSAKFETLETLIYDCAHKLFQKHPNIERLDLEVKKPQAIPKAQFARVKQTFFK